MRGCLERPGHRRRRSSSAVAWFGGPPLADDGRRRPSLDAQPASRPTTSTSPVDADPPLELALGRADRVDDRGDGRRLAGRSAPTRSTLTPRRRRSPRPDGDARSTGGSTASSCADAERRRLRGDDRRSQGPADGARPRRSRSTARRSIAMALAAFDETVRRPPDRRDARRAEHPPVSRDGTAIDGGSSGDDRRAARLTALVVAARPGHGPPRRARSVAFRSASTSVSIVRTARLELTGTLGRVRAARAERRGRRRRVRPAARTRCYPSNMAQPRTTPRSPTPPRPPRPARRQARRSRPVRVERRAGAGRASPRIRISSPSGSSSSRRSPATTRRPTSTPVGEAFDLAVEAHEGQRRATGEPYVTHPIASAQITAELGIDPVAVQAALLHDVPEDTEYSLPDLEERFGAEVAHMVDGVTKLSKFSTHSHEQQQAENIRKMLLAMAEDIRVVLIKLADRLHNMRTLYALPSEKQLRIARQTMEIYAPLAERLGIWQIKWELEDLAFKVLEPERFRELAKLLDTRRKGREGYIERAIAELEPQLKAAGIEADLQGRPKHIYSIYKKMQRKSRRVRRDLRRLRDPDPRRRRPRLLRGPRHRPRPVAADPGPVRRLHRGPQEQPLPVAPHRGHRPRRQAARDPDPDPRDAPGQRGRHRRPLALQGRLEVRPRVRRQARLAAPAHGLAARRQRRDRVRRGDQARHLPGPGLRVHPEGRHQGPAGRRDAARLRLPDPHRRRPPDDRGEGQQPPRPARLPAEERRHRRDRHDEGRARPVARLDERRPDLATPGRRSANGSSARTATRTSSTAASRSSASCGGWPARASRRSATTRSPRSSSSTTWTRSTTSTRRSATARSAPSRSSCGSASSTTRRSALPTVAPPTIPARTGGVRVKGVGDLLVRFAKCCHPIPGDPIVGFITRGKGVTVHLQSCPTVLNEREVPRLIEVEWEAAPAQTYPIAIRVEALRPDGPAQRHHPGRRREQGQHRRRGGPREPRPHRDRDRDAPGRVGLAARPGHEPDRGAQGRPRASSATSARRAPGRRWIVAAALRAHGRRARRYGARGRLPATPNRAIAAGEAGG